MRVRSTRTTEYSVVAQMRLKHPSHDRGGTVRQFMDPTHPGAASEREPGSSTGGNDIKATLSNFWTDRWRRQLDLRRDQARCGERSRLRVDIDISGSNIQPLHNLITIDGEYGLQVRSTPHGVLVRITGNAISPLK